MGNSGEQNYQNSELGKKSVARFLLFFYSIDIDTLEVELGYIRNRDLNHSKDISVELQLSYVRVRAEV